MQLGVTEIVLPMLRTEEEIVPARQPGRQATAATRTIDGRSGMVLASLAGWPGCGARRGVPTARDGRRIEPNQRRAADPRGTSRRVSTRAARSQGGWATAPPTFT
jgi:hypothetical protein